MRSAAVLVTLLVCTAGFAFAVHYALELRAATAPPSPAAFVQAAWSVYRFGPGHRTHVGMLALDCTACHRSDQNGALAKPSPSVCIDCHEERSDIRHALIGVDDQGARTTPEHASQQQADCISCHGFGPDPEKQARDCMSCHARAQGSLSATTMHADQECTKCHDVHQNRIAPIDCQSCHTQEVQHRPGLDTGAQTCLDCHAAHAPAHLAQTSCRDCHGTQADQTSATAIAASATFSGGHACTSCHAPHDFSPKDTSACTSCHQGHVALQGQGHAECTACHDPHAVRASVAERNVCTSCHTQVKLQHSSSIAAEVACTTCHEAHPAARAPERASCTSCHQTIAASDLTAHAAQVACTGCHAPHDFVQAESGHESCVSCHAARLKQLANHPGHARCESCHTALPHGGTPKALACASCHEEKAKAVAPGHATCTQCHDQHTGTREKTCNNCHAAQAAHLSEQHGTCNNCHDAHAAVPVPAVSQCSACHQKNELPALHQEPKHAPCASCHDVHGSTPPAARASCLSCHQDRVDHQPEATRCDGCHAFVAPPKPRSKP